MTGGWLSRLNDDKHDISQTDDDVDEAGLVLMLKPGDMDNEMNDAL